MRSAILAASAAFLAAGCASSPPKSVENLCLIFEERPKWFKAASRSQERWGTPVQIQMAILRQESSFRADARPPRKKFLGFLPGPRKSSAYGYAQVKDSTWDWYRKATGRGGADRDDFEDAIDFVGWYTDVSQKELGLSKWDPYSQYLAYHEGHGGYRRGSYKAKPALQRIATSVQQRAETYGAQLRGCEDRLDSSWWPFG